MVRISTLTSKMVISNHNPVKAEKPDPKTNKGLSQGTLYYFLNRYNFSTAYDFISIHARYHIQIFSVLLDPHINMALYKFFKTLK